MRRRLSHDTVQKYVGSPDKPIVFATHILISTRPKRCPFSKLWYPLLYSPPRNVAWAGAKGRKRAWGYVTWKYRNYLMGGQSSHDSDPVCSLRPTWPLNWPALFGNGFARNILPTSSLACPATSSNPPPSFSPGISRGSWWTSSPAEMWTRKSWSRSSSRTAQHVMWVVNHFHTYRPAQGLAWNVSHLLVPQPKPRARETRVMGLWHDAHSHFAGFWGVKIGPRFASATKELVFHLMYDFFSFSIFLMISSLVLFSPGADWCRGHNWGSNGNSSAQLKGLQGKQGPSSSQLD